MYVHIKTFNNICTKKRMVPDSKICQGEKVTKFSSYYRSFYTTLNCEEFSKTS